MLSNSLILEVDYVGSAGVKQSIYANLNAALPGPGVIGVDKHRIYGDSYGAMSLITNQASSIYHSLQIKLEKRFSNGLQFLSSYAWGHEIDIGGSCFSCSSTPQDPYNWKADRANGTFDMRHIYTLSYFYQLPVGKGRHYMAHANPIINQVLGGWELSGILHYNTGPPLGVWDASDVANIGGPALAQRTNWVGGFPRKVLDPADRRLGWINPANYAPPDAYSYGNAGRNLEFAPGDGYFNPAILKDFPLHGERPTLQFRAEFFNVLNQHAMGCFSTTYQASNFGQATCTDQGSREVQFALKVLF